MKTIIMSITIEAFPELAERYKDISFVKKETEKGIVYYEELTIIK
mgnify:CR=1 FL=1